MITDEEIQEQIARGKKYTLIFLKAGPNRDRSEAEAQRLQMEHLRFLFDLKERGVAPLHGPLFGHPELRGLSVYAIEDQQEALRVASQDPAVQAGSLVLEAHEWFSIPGSALS